MQAPVSHNPQPALDRKSAASVVLRWVNEEITQAPEDHIRSLADNISLSGARAALRITEATGEKITSSVFTSVDGNRLNNLHLAAAHDPNDGDGRKNASEHSVKVSKLLTLEHKLIDSDLVQYTVPPDAARLGAQSRHDRGNAARYLIETMDVMRNSTLPAEKEVAREPMMKAFYNALKEVEGNGEQISIAIATAMENNANQKLFLSLSPTVHDAAGESRAYFEKQSAAYRTLITLCKSKDLIHGISAEAQRVRT